MITHNPRDIVLYEEKELDIKQNFQEARKPAELLGETENLRIIEELEKEILKKTIRAQYSYIYVRKSF